MRHFCTRVIVRVTHLPKAAVLRAIMFPRCGVHTRPTPLQKKKKIPEKQLENLEIAGKHLDLLQYAVEVITVQKLKIVA